MQCISTQSWPVLHPPLKTHIHVLRVVSQIPEYTPPFNTHIHILASSPKSLNNTPLSPPIHPPPSRTRLQVYALLLGVTSLSLLTAPLLIFASHALLLTPSSLQAHSHSSPQHSPALSPKGKHGQALPHIKHTRMHAHTHSHMHTRAHTQNTLASCCSPP